MLTPMQRYRLTENGKAMEKAYRQSESGKIARARWWKKNPEKKSIYNKNRYTLHAGQNTTVTESEWNNLVEAHNNQCSYCFEEAALTQDHVIPLSRGGLHAIENIVPACQPCNSKKGDR